MSNDIQNQNDSLQRFIEDVKRSTVQFGDLLQARRSFQEAFEAASGCNLRGILDAFEDFKSAVTPIVFVATDAPPAARQAQLDQVAVLEGFVDLLQKELAENCACDLLSVGDLDRAAADRFRAGDQEPDVSGFAEAIEALGRRG